MQQHRSRPRGFVVGLAPFLAALVLGLPAAADDLFVDRARESGLDFDYFNGMTGLYYFPEISGGGGAFFDYDDDGDLDVYLVQGNLLGHQDVRDALIPPRGPLRDRLYRNDLDPHDPGAGLRFTDVTEASGIRSEGYGMGVTTGDFDNDGRVDLYISNLGPDRLLRNRGDGTFSDVTERSGLDNPGWSVPAVFVDYDLDGFLDLFVGSYVVYSTHTEKECRNAAGRRDYCGPLSYEPTTDALWRNRGDGTFENVTARAGLAGATGTALGAVAGDFDGDGRPDIYVANDGLPNHMWIQSGDGTFHDEALLRGTAVNVLGRPEAGMGVTVGDFDADGDDDIFLTHLMKETNTLYRNEGGGLFEDVTAGSGLDRSSWSATGFGTAWLDVDNDGWLDLFVANGSVHILPESQDVYPLKQPNHLYRGLGKGRFEEISGRAGAVFREEEVSRGVAVGDVDNDGDSDILLVNNSGPTRLLINTGGIRRPWIGLRILAGSKGGRPRDALGARVGLVREGRPVLWRSVSTSGSYSSASDPRVLVGLGDDAVVHQALVRWPAGDEEVFKVEIGRHQTLVRGTGEMR